VGGTADDTVPPRAGRRAPATLAAVGLASAAIAGGLGWWLGARPSADAAPRAAAMRFVVEPDSATLRGSAPALSPDGRTLVYVAGTAEGTRLYARPLDEIEARAIEGTEEAREPFFSPDGAWIGFVSAGTVRRVPLTGGTPTVVTQLPNQQPLLTAAWGPDDHVYFTTGDFLLYRRRPAAGPRCA
jgi:hypothetical protein